MKKIFTISLLCSAAAVCFLDAGTASAGVLLNSSNVTSSLSSRPMRIRVPRPPKSTYAMKRTMPSLGKGSMWGIEDQIKIIEQEQKQQEKLEKWNKRQLATLEKKLRREERERQRLERKLKHKEEALKRKAEKARLKSKKRGEAAQIEEESGPNLTEEKSKDKSETLPSKAKPQKDKKPSFWARLKRAIFGGRQNS